MVGLVLAFVVGLIAFLPFPSWQQLVGFITSATVLSFASGPLVLARHARAGARHCSTVSPQRRLGDRLPGAVVVEPDRLLDRVGHQLEDVARAILLGFVLLIAQQTFAKRTTPALDLRHGLVAARIVQPGVAVISSTSAPTQPVVEGGLRADHRRDGLRRSGSGSAPRSPPS